MCRPHFFVSLSLACCLAGCASGPNLAVCTGVPNLIASPSYSTLEYKEYTPPRHRKATRHQPSEHTTSRENVPIESLIEPKAFSTEWWARENARVRSRMVICRDCFPPTTARPTQDVPKVVSGKSEAQVESDAAKQDNLEREERESGNEADTTSSVIDHSRSRF